MRLRHAQLPEEARDLDKELRALLKEKDAAVRGQVRLEGTVQSAALPCFTVLVLSLPGVGQHSCLECAHLSALFCSFELVM